MPEAIREQRYNGFLSSTDITEEIKKGESSQIRIWINGELIDSNSPQITHVGYDVSLGDRKPFDLTSHRFLDIKELGNSRLIEVKPGHTVSVETEEDVALGQGIGALVESKVRMVSQGFSHISTTIDPTWHGKLLLTFTNLSGKRLRIRLGTPIATLVFFKFISPAIGRADVNDRHNQDTWVKYEDMDIKARRLRRYIIPGVTLVIILLLGWYVSSVDWQEAVKFYHGLTEDQKGIVNLIIGGVGSAFVIMIFTIFWKTVSRIFQLCISETIRK